MPVDHRRICGPTDDTVSPVNEEKIKQERAKSLLEKGKRQDGRTAEEIRKMFIRPDAVTQAKGSAYIETGQTKIICSVYGPRESLRRQEFRMKGRLTCEVKYAPFSCHKRRSPLKDSEERDLSNIITQALEPAVMMEKFPKAQIDIYIMVLENDGNVLAAAINCTCVALADAGIEMYDLVTACSLIQEESQTLLDPVFAEVGTKVDMETYECSQHAGGVVTVAFLPVLNQISVLNMDGELSLQQTNKAVKSCIEGCARIYPVIYNCIIEHTRRSLKEP